MLVDLNFGFGFLGFGSCGGWFVVMLFGLGIVWLGIIVSGAAAGVIRVSGLIWYFGFWVMGISCGACLVGGVTVEFGVVVLWFGICGLWLFGLVVRQLISVLGFVVICSGLGCYIFVFYLSFGVVFRYFVFVYVAVVGGGGYFVSLDFCVGLDFWVVWLLLAVGGLGFPGFL